MGKVRERWRPSSVVGMAVVGVFGLAVVALAVATVVIELWGQPLLDISGGVRNVPVWMTWVAVAAGLVGGFSLVFSCAGYLIRVARGQVPRVQPTRESRRRRDADRKRDYDARRRHDRTPDQRDRRRPDS
ncbi:hypothetical protein [Herbiconiux liukaitaii]|uniref:hypothetical protein n=1 Tax=Herbiconiux liukaitaii TaxID=3342799 RepID=UPI0035B9234B